MHKRQLLRRFFSAIIFEQKGTLFNNFIVYSLLFLLIILMSIGMGLLRHYNNQASVMLPQSVALLDMPVDEIHKVLETAGIKKYLAGDLYNIDRTTIQTSEGNHLLEDAYSIFAFDFFEKLYINVKCDAQIVRREVYDMYVTRKGEWRIKIEPVECSASSFEIQNNEYAYRVNTYRTNPRFTYFQYHSNPKDDQDFFPILINLIKKIFVNYYPSSRYYNKNDGMTLFVKEHEAMLSGLFSLYFAKTYPKMIANITAYDAISNYDRVQVSVRFLSKDFDHKTTIIQKLPFELGKYSKEISNAIFLSNKKALKSKHTKRSFIFFYEDVDVPYFKNLDWIDIENERTKDNVLFKDISYLIIVLVLVSVMIHGLFLYAFLKRLYRTYRHEFFLTLLYGRHSFFVLKIMSFILVVALFTSIGASLIILNVIQNIFNLYYIDAFSINFLFIAALLLVVFAMSLLFVALLEYREQSILLKGANRVKNCRY